MRKSARRGRPKLPQAEKLRDLTVRIRPDQHEKIEKSGVNISRIVRKWIDLHDLQKIDQMN